MRTGMYDALNNFFTTFGQHWMKKLVFVVTDWTRIGLEKLFQQEVINYFYYKAFVNAKQIHDDLPFVFFEALGDGDTQQQRWEKSANQLWQYVSQHERMHFRLIDEVLEEIEGCKSLSEKMSRIEQEMKEMEEKCDKDEEGNFLILLLTLPFPSPTKKLIDK